MKKYPALLKPVEVAPEATPAPAAEDNGLREVAQALNESTAASRSMQANLVALIESMNTQPSGQIRVEIKRDRFGTMDGLVIHKT